MLTEICSCYGTVADIEFVTFPGTKKLKGVAYVKYSSIEETKMALSCLAPTKSMPKLESEEEVKEEYANGEKI